MPHQICQNSELTGVKCGYCSIGAIRLEKYAGLERSNLQEAQQGPGPFSAADG